MLIYNKYVLSTLTAKEPLLTSSSGWRVWTASLLGAGLGALLGGVEALLILTLRVRLLSDNALSHR